MQKIVIAGAAGRTGSIIVKCAAKTRDVKVTGAIESASHPKIGTDAGEIADIGKLGIALSSDLKTALSNADVLIDFTFHTVVANNVQIASALKKPVIIGTTGLDDAETKAVKDASKVIPIVWAPNMSLGVNLLFAMVRKSAEALGMGYSIEIDETHHIHKKDAPSGTALKLGEKAAEGIKKDFKQTMIHDPEGTGNIHDQSKIVIRSYRKGEVIGDHTVSFENEGERIELTHHAESREAFAMGAVRAAQWITGKKPGLYDMQDVLGLKS